MITIFFIFAGRGRSEIGETGEMGEMGERGE
jgi:hypothetical protein